jgi:hypothetical protein
VSATEIQLDYRDLSSLGPASPSERDAPAERRPAGQGDGGIASVAGGALAFTGRARGDNLFIDFAEFVDSGHQRR